MSNFTNELTNYQSIPRELIFDNTLSDRARFLFCYMAAKPNGWNFFQANMARELNYSIDTLRKYINELIKSGWLIKGEQSKDDGRFGAVNYTLKAEKGISANEKIDDEKLAERGNSTTTKKPRTEKSESAVEKEVSTAQKADKEKTRHGKTQTHKDNILFTEKREEKERDFFSFLEKNEKIAAFLSASSAWSIWQSYLTEQYNAQKTMLTIHGNKLYEYSDGNDAVATEIVERAILGGYRTLKPLNIDESDSKEERYGGNTTETQWE